MNQSNTNQIFLNPLHINPPLLRDSEVLAAAVRSFLTQSIEEPTEVYDESGFRMLKDYPEELIYIGYTTFKAYLTDKFLSVPDLSSTVPGIDVDATAHVGNPSSWGEVYGRIRSNVTAKSRLSKTKTGYSLSLYVGDVDINYYSLLDAAQYSSKLYEKTGQYLSWMEQRELNQKVEKALCQAKAAIFGKSMLDLSKSIDLTIKVANPFTYVPASAFLDAEMTDENSIDAFKQAFQSFRLISPQLSGGSNASYNMFQAADGSTHYTTDTLPEGELKEYTIHSMSRRTFEGFVNFNIPMAVAEYVTQSPKEKVTSGKLGMWFFQWSANAIHPNGSGDFSEIINPLSNIAAINAPHESKAAPKTNENDLSIDASGQIVYLPTVNKAEMYDELYNSIGTKEDGNFCSNDIKDLPGNVAPISGPRARSDISVRRFPENMLIYTDWINGKLSYTNTGGVMQILDIDSYSPASATSVRSVLDTPMLEESTKSKSALSALSNFIRHYAPTAIDDYITANLQDWKNVFGDWGSDDNMPYQIRSLIGQAQGSSLAAFVSSLYWRMRNAYNESERGGGGDLEPKINTAIMLDYLEMEEWTIKEFSTSSGLPPLHCVGHALELAWQNASTGDKEELTDKLFSGKSVLSNMVELGICISVAKYVNKYAEVAAKDREDRKIYMEAKRDPDYVPLPVPMVKDKYFLPHQAKNDSILAKKPKNAILSVSAGGGKTIQMIVDMLRNLGDGTSKRPLVLCPGFLVKNYVEDIAYLTEGKLNAIIVNSETMRTYGEDKLRAMIKAAPPNTVVLSDYDFISRGRASGVPYGIGSINISQNAEFMREFDFDSCLTGDTLVHTNKGTVRYDSIVGHIPVGTKQPLNGWNILTKNGMKPIIMGSHSVKRVYSIQTQSGIVIRGSDNHPFYVLNDKLRFEWKQVRDLVPGDTLCVERTNFAFNTDPVTLSLPDIKVTGNYQKSYKKPTVVTKGLARFAGYMIAEGYVGKTVEFSQHDDDILADFDRLTQEVFGTVFQKYTGRRVKGSTELVSWCTALGLKNPSKNHSVPEYILQSPKEIQIEFLRGYAEGDGGVDGFQVAFTSQSSLLLQQIQIMMLNLGIVSFVTYGQDDRFDPPLPHNNLCIKGKSDISKFAEIIGFIGKPRSKRLDALVNSDWGKIHSHTTKIPGLQYAHTWIKKHRGCGNGKYLCSDGTYKHKTPIVGQGNNGFDENYSTLHKSLAKGDLLQVCPSLHTHFQEIAGANFFFDPIAFIAKGVKEDVYDIEVKGEHTFIANGLVTHNCYMDESHNLKNADSLRSQFTQRIINPIPLRRLATGTFTPNQTSDVIGQMNMLDPSIFGDIDDFIEQYAEGKVGNVFLWKDGAEKEVARRIASNSALITCKRKEWQFLLPLKQEKFYAVDLSTQQRSVYDAIMEEEIEKIKSNEKLRKKLESGDENDAAAIETMLKGYLQRVERFLAAPAFDELGNKILEGEDRISPKGLQVAKLFEEHLASGDQGKVLVFTSYIPSAQAIYDSLPPNLQSQTLYYTSANKANDLATFNKDPRIKFLVGVENSLKEGLNLQVASRLIRVETVWSPGALEQAESRINRPDPKNNDPTKQRTKIYLDWLVVNNTIDVTKTARLISKMIKTTKFEEQDNPAYADVPDNLKPILMTMNNILHLNSWENHLQDYLQGYNQLKVAEKRDYDNFRKHLDFKTTSVPIVEGTPIAKAALIPNVPYIEAMTLPQTEKLGIKSFSDYVSEHGSDEDDAYKLFDATGMRVHTEYGDGVVTNSRESTMWVMLDVGTKVSVKKLKTFIIIEDIKGATRQRLAALNGLPFGTAKKAPVAAPPAAPKPPVDSTEVEKKGKREPVPNTDTTQNTQFNLYVGVINNMAAVGIDDDDPDVPAAALKKLGFAFSGPYTYCHIPTARAMNTFIGRITDNYTIPKANLDVLESLAEAFNMGRKKLLNVQQASGIEMQNFWRLAKRPVPKGTLKPYPIVQDGLLYIAFWAVGQPSLSSLPTKMAGIPGVSFDNSDGEYFAFFPNKTQLKSFVRDLRLAGYTIGNMDTVKEQYAALTLASKTR